MWIKKKDYLPRRRFSIVSFISLCLCDWIIKPVEMFSDNYSSLFFLKIHCYTLTVEYISRKKHTWHDKWCNHSELWIFFFKFFMILFWIHVHVFEKKTPNYLSKTFAHKSCWLFLYVLWIEFLYHLPRLLFDLYLT